MSQDKSVSRGVTRREVVCGALGMAAWAAAARAEAAGPAPVRPLQGKKVLIAIGDFSEGMETYYMVYRLMEEGAVPVVAAPTVKLLQMVVHDFEPQYTNYTEKLGYTIKTQVAFKDIQPAKYQGLLIPGGRGPEEIRQNRDALRVVGYFLDKNLPVGAMCHGPQVLWAARSVKGRKIAAYVAIKPDVEAAGAIYCDEPAVVDGNLVTSRGWPDLPVFMPKFLELLGRR